MAFAAPSLTTFVTLLPPLATQNLPPGVTDQLLVDKCSPHGVILWIKFVSPECALVRFRDQSSVAICAASLNGAPWAGHVLQVEACNQRSAAFNLRLHDELQSLR